jgi:hypothetical protein
MSKGGLLVTLLLSCGSVVFGQVAPQTQGIGPITQASQQNQEIFKRQQESLVDESARKLRGLDSETDSSSALEARGYLPEPRLSKEQKLLITPLKEDLEKFAVFLKEPKTGIFKIMPARCGDERVVNAGKSDCLQPESDQLAYYSFRKKLYGAQDWLDLRYQDKSLWVGVRRLTIGLIVDLGETDLESLSADSAEVKALAALLMPKKSEDIDARKKEIEKGIDAGAFKFFHNSAVVTGRTYLLRSYAYRTRESALNDKRIDIIVALKIVGIDENHGLTVIWKELSRANSHQL